ncbi:MAG: hypothetical protein AAF184_23130, partial [Pseudomonadota bacterium]
MRLFSVTLLAALTAWSPLALATQSAERLTPLPRACEEALALSALPLRLREQASVYALTDQGFELTRRSDGPFTCIVERNHARSIIP